LEQPGEAGFLKLIEENQDFQNPPDLCVEGRRSGRLQFLFQIWRALPELKDNTYATIWLH
jgi:hypothetical protein